MTSSTPAADFSRYTVEEARDPRRCLLRRLGTSTKDEVRKVPSAASAHDPLQNIHAAPRGGAATPTFTEYPR